MAVNAPARIHAKVHGFRTSIPDGARRLAGGWDEIAYGGTTEYVRADIVSDMLENLKATEVALRAVTASGLLRHSNTVLLPLLESVQDAIAKAEGGAS